MMPVNKNILLLFFLFCSFFVVSAQSVGDTIRVQAFNFESTTRDSLISFPNNLNFEKVLLKYKMRCKDGLVSTTTDRNKGCGEWDYSCNTYLVDSTKVELSQHTHPNFTVSNFIGSTYNYTSQQTYDRYNFVQKEVNYTVVSETSHSIGSGNDNLNNVLSTINKTGRSYILVKASELIASGLSAGDIDGLSLSVLNTGGAANFFRLKIKNTSQSSLSASAIEVDGFSEVYFNDFNFVSGFNRIQFHTPYNWDGSSNIILETSFSNDSESNNIIFSGNTSTDVRTLTASNTASLDFSGDAFVEASTQFFNTVNEQITVMFWAKGNDLMPTNNFVVSGKGSDYLRELNIHLPWGNEVYFDCGNENNSFDRINKPFVLEEIKGQWNHWAFTKNASTGVMNIYHNGTLWHTGNGNNNLIEIVDLLIGKEPGRNEVFNGEFKEFSFWDKALDGSVISNWKNKTIDNTHPDYSNLVSYYKFDETQGQTVFESKNSLTDNGTNLIWKYTHGNLLTTTFSESMSYPNLLFYRGSYTQTVTDHVEQYLHPKSFNVVNEYEVVDNSGVYPIVDDEIIIVSTNYYFEAIPENVYDGDTGNIISTVPVTIENTITIEDLNYIRRNPFYNELVSFVTPYGINLDFGLDGKEWYFDMSDYVSLLKGDKRLVMTLGGQWQEDMDLEFLFIVGTPPRDVIQYDQIWQGTNRIGAAPISQILNDVKFAPENILLDSGASEFKLKSSITGHGSEGEFHQNGGIIHHKILLDNVEQFDWTITQECSENPVYPQGGTWIYDRQGWCPGERTLLKEQDITPFATPGSNLLIDYNTSIPSNSNGDYRYQVSHQLVGYGPANHTLDASVVGVIAPNNSALYARVGQICANPTVIIQNTGSTTLTSVSIDYWINDSQSPQTYQWTGSLEFMETEEVVISSPNELWFDIQGSNNTFTALVYAPNNGSDEYSHNNRYTSNFDFPELIPQVFTLEFKTNNRAFQNSYEILDSDNNVVGSNPLPTNNTVYLDDYDFALGCFKLKVVDTGGDGVQWWANPGQGVGYIKINDSDGNNIKTFNPDFGGAFEYSFTTDFALSIDELEFLTSIKVYPNPTANYCTINANEIRNASITFHDLLGKQLNLPIMNIENNEIVYNMSMLPSGVYIATIKKDRMITTRKIIKN